MWTEKMLFLLILFFVYKTNYTFLPVNIFENKIFLSPEVVKVLSLVGKTTKFLLAIDLDFLMKNRSKIELGDQSSPLKPPSLTLTRHIPTPVMVLLFCDLNSEVTGDSTRRRKIRIDGMLGDLSKAFDVVAFYSYGYKCWV